MIPFPLKDIISEKIQNDFTRSFEQVIGYVMGNGRLEGIVHLIVACQKIKIIQLNLSKMPRILAIDYGQKRTGIAVTDELQIIASGLTTIPSATTINFLKDYFSKEKVSKVLIGEPKQMNGEPSESAVVIEAFVKKFRSFFPDMPIVRVDERFTSKLAFQTMIDSGLNKKQRQNKALIDEISATIMLQDYLTRKMI